MLAEWAGSRPERFLHCLGRAYAARSVTADAGAGPERDAGDLPLSDLARAVPLTWGADAPASRAAVALGHGLAATPSGDACWRGPPAACHLAFAVVTRRPCSSATRPLWSAAALVRDDAHRTPPGAGSSCRALPPRWLQPPGLPPAEAANPPQAALFHLILRGAPFHSASGPPLMRIPPGRLMSYRQLATLLGHAGCTAQRRQRSRATLSATSYPAIA